MIELNIQAKFRDGIWAVVCDEQPGLILCHEDLSLCLKDFVPALQVLDLIESEYV